MRPRVLDIQAKAHEAFLDEGEQRGVVGNRVRDVVRVRERGDRDEGDAEAELIEARARRRVRTRRREAGADAGGVERAQEAVRPAAGLLARWRVREIGTLARTDPVGVWPAGLLRLRGRNVVIEAAVLVVGDEEDRILPARARPKGVGDLGDEVLTRPDVRRRMLVVLEQGGVGPQRIAA